MENNKKGNGLVILLIVLLLVFASVSVLFITGVIKSPFVKETTNVETSNKTTITTESETTNTGTVNNSSTIAEANQESNSVNSDTSSSVEKAKTKESLKSNLSESELSKETSISLLDNNCGNVNAKIVDGNIKISDSNSNEITIKTGNAKYLYKKSFSACDNVYLLFINSKGQIYSIKTPQLLINKGIENNKSEFSMSDISEKFKKLTNTQDRAVAFIKKDGIVPNSSTDEYGYTSKNVGFLDEDGFISTVTYDYILLP